MTAPGGLARACGEDMPDTSGAGATTAIEVSSALRCMPLVGASGTAGAAEFHATIFGTATSWFSLIFGGVIIVCVRLSASGGTEMIGCFANSGSPFCGTRAGALPVSIGGRYSEGV